MHRLIFSLERLVVAVGIVAALLLLPLVLATSWEVVARYAFGAPTIWAYEVGYVLTGSHFLLGLAYTLRYGEHIRIDVLSTHLSPRTRRRIDSVVYTLLLPLLAWLVVALYNYLTAGYVRGETSGQSALNLPVWPFRLVFLLAFAMLTLQVLCELLKSFQTPPNPEEAQPS